MTEMLFEETLPNVKSNSIKACWLPSDFQEFLNDHLSVLIDFQCLFERWESCFKNHLFGQCVGSIDHFNYATRSVQSLYC